MWRDEFDTGRRSSSHNQDHHDPNFDALLKVGLAVAVAAFFASMLPLPLVAPAMRDLLQFGAFGAVMVAALRAERVFDERLTAWDQAALLMLLSLLCGFFVDPQAVAEALNTALGDARVPPA